MDTPHWLGVLVVDGAVLIGGVLGLAVLLLVLLGVRRRAITRHGGTFDCAMRGPGRRRFRLATARYSDDRLECFRWFSLTLRPQVTLCRSDLAVDERRTPAAREHLLLGAADVEVLDLSSESGSCALALGGGALTGFLAWLEAAPPRSASAV